VSVRYCSCLTPRPITIEGVAICDRCSELIPPIDLAPFIARLAELEKRLARFEAGDGGEPADELWGLKQAATYARCHPKTVSRNRGEFGFAPGATRARASQVRAAVRERKGAA